MASYSSPHAVTASVPTPAAGVAPVADTVTIAQSSKKVRVLNLGAADLFVRHDGVTATVNGADNFVVPSEGQYVFEFPKAKVPNFSAVAATATQYTFVREA